MQSMKRDLAIGSGISALTLAFALVWGGPFVGAGTAYAQDQAPQAQQPQDQTPGGEPGSQAPGAQSRQSTFTGTIVKQGSEFALRDSSGAVYKLDSSDQAKRYEGKAVKVTGQLDTQAMTIHVESIEAAQG